MNLPPARRPWLVSSELSHSSAHTRDSGDETRAGTRRKEAEERARACGWKRVQRGDRSRRGSGHLRDGDTRERERELRRRAALPPLHSLLSSRDAISIPRRIHRESNRRENAEGASSTSRQKQVKKNSRDLISLFAEKKSRQNRPPPSPPRTALPPSRIACISRRGIENKLTDN